MGIPSPLSSRYFSTWSYVRKGATVLESIPSRSGEEWVGLWNGVGLYEGNEKLQGYQDVAVHLTNYRLIIIPDIDSALPDTPAVPLQAHLSHVRQTEYYSGFIRSSPKITLTMGVPPSTQDEGDDGWTCRVCGYVNERNGLAQVPKCGLCGVPYTQAAPSKTSLTSRPAALGSSGLTNGKDGGNIACPACTFLNSSLIPNCEICATRLPRPADRFVAHNSATAKTQTVRFSFRKGGEKDAYKKLKSILGNKAWEGESTTGSTIPIGNVNGDSMSSGAGIDSILQSIDQTSKAQNTHMQSAFADLEALMLRAGEMVSLSQSLNAKLTSQQQSQNQTGLGGNKVSDEDVTMIRTSLVQLGLAAPALTKEMVKSEQLYHQGLAKELAGILTGNQEGYKEGLMSARGREVIGLDEVWGLWMRARGIALFPPQTLIDILPYLPTYTSPQIHSLSLPSSLTVLHTPPFSPTSVSSRVLNFLQPTSTQEQGKGTEKSLSLVEFSSRESLPLGLAQEYVELMEAQGGLVRDDQAGQAGGEVRWYRNIIDPWPLST
ncbi:hypothetical protein L204_103906 [Cryptococcus depauperatus]|nr:ESCRT-II complex subunit VPS36 [Cryptococcus depauperatus CBS 7855]